MKTAPIAPAQIEFNADESPISVDFADIYHSCVGAFQQAQDVFLQGNGLPERWQGRTRFVVCEIGFGLGSNFLATWAAWRADEQRCERLVFIGIEKHPPLQADLAQAHASSPVPDLAAQLVDAWPPLTHNLHGLQFEEGRLELLLALGDARDWARELVAQVDAFYLDGFAPERNPDLWDPYLFKSLAKLAAPEATAASWCPAGTVRRD
ncbi:MAG TPA: tRNA (5-methylaminomethyl-2-thiouridine)(34)-methyltransferase MnmD, partial [Burkholderiaceae bacterium]